ncbi:hypothetical protein Sp245p_16335 (plasmid) [Azospirillum baldaniorum]|uniref:Uncharacterized protein n=1 Tax=Azospirillum baldaniorum TaxID=1064539 RepID=A0A9P1NNH5_9PROT|nr:hypothetical protein [Azospirillum baldaniorum]AWJ91413.1 hypothetical protein Sp245p_16335 [Azospirillum baldaniorum]TWA83731.1 hypothetical protein FBZ85_101480 [Azospirillum brasilense]CCC99701.1 protein of unknown function [Azospirillum baldaniorum]
MIDLTLRADTEQALAAALPWLRTADGWVLTGPPDARHDLDPIGALVRVEAVLDYDGNTVTPADVDGRFHANLLLDDDHPDATAILAAAGPFVVAVTPEKRRRVWA